MQNPYARYKEQSVMTMTQGDMINLLFDEVINRLNKGLVSLEQNDYGTGGRSAPHDCRAEGSVFPGG